MKNINTMGRLEYLLNNLFWSFIGVILYGMFLFCPILTLEYKKALWLLAGVVIVGTGAGILCTVKRRRNYISVFVNVISSLGIYFSVSLWNIDRSLLIAAGAIAVLLVAAYSLLVWITFQGTTGVGSSKCFFACLLSNRTIIAFVFGITLIVTLVKPMMGLAAIEHPANDVSLTKAEETVESETISKNLETVLLLQEDEWDKLDAEARLSVLKTVADIEANYLGIPQVAVCSNVLFENTLGYYDHDAKTIMINLSYLATTDAQTMLRTVCHEIYHAYQYRLIDLYNQLDPQDSKLLLFSRVEQYRTELANYINGKEDYYAYAGQSCEADSNYYAEIAVIEYYERIEQYNETE